jgi:hypothetical protein
MLVIRRPALGEWINTFWMVLLAKAVTLIRQNGTKESDWNEILLFND